VIEALEPQDMMRLRNADYRNANYQYCNDDYRYRNADYRNADYHNTDYHNADYCNADYRNAGLSGIQSVRYQTEKDLTMPEPIRYQNKTMQSGIFLLRYRTEMTDGGILMPALVLRLPMPTYAKNSYEKMSTYA
jgi:hypothetical protein